MFMERFVTIKTGFLGGIDLNAVAFHIKNGRIPHLKISDDSNEFPSSIAFSSLLEVVCQQGQIKDLISGKRADILWDCSNAWGSMKALVDYLYESGAIHYAMKVTRLLLDMCETSGMEAQKEKLDELIFFIDAVIMGDIEGIGLGAEIEDGYCIGKHGDLLLSNALSWLQDFSKKADEAIAEAETYSGEDVLGMHAAGVIRGI
jgi:hypothetical protein